MAIEDVAKKAMEAEIGLIRMAAEKHPDHEAVKANQHVLKAGPKTWSCGGTMQLGGFVWWGLNVDIIFTDFKRGFMFTAKGGPDWAVTGVACAVTGSFVVDPKTLSSQKCRFTLKQGSVGEGYITLTLYKTDGTFLGSMSGLAEGLGFASLSGEGKLTMAS